MLEARMSSSALSPTREFCGSLLAVLSGLTKSADEDVRAPSVEGTARCK